VGQVAGDSFAAFSLDDELAQIPEALNATVKQVDKAVSRALISTARWIKTRVVREMSIEFGLKLKAVRQRVFVSTNKVKSKRIAKIWLGLNPIDAMAAKKVVETESGVLSGDHFFAGAFMASIRQGSSVRVYKRTGSQRFPVNKQLIPLSGREMEIANKFSKMAETKFRDELSRQFKQIRI